MRRVNALSELTVITVIFWTITLTRSLILLFFSPILLTSSVDASQVFSVESFAIPASLQFSQGRLDFRICSPVVAIFVWFFVFKQLESLIENECKSFVLSKKTLSGTHNAGAYEGSEASHRMHKTCTTCILKTQILEPAVIPAPGKAHWKNQTWIYKGEEQVVVYLHPLGNGTCGYLSHHYAQRQVENEHRVVLVREVQPKEVVLTH